MITLKTLPQATAQEVFDQVKNHLLTQNERCLSADGWSCAYRSGNLKCAAGCLIGDDEYDPSMGSSTWDLLVLRGAVPTAHSNLIRSLQSIHDGMDPECWPDKLKERAELFNLKYE